MLLSQVPFRHASAKRVGVVACVSPFFYFERWQSLVVSLEVYRQFGVDVQILYVQSMISSVFEFLKVCPVETHQ